MKKYARILRFDLFYIYGFACLLFSLAFHKAIFYIVLFLYFLIIKNKINIKFLFLLLFLIFVLIHKPINTYINNIGMVIEKDELTTIYSKGNLYHLNDPNLFVGDIVKIEANITKYQNVFYANGYNPYITNASKNIMGSLSVINKEKIGHLPIFDIRENLIDYIKKFEITNNYIALIIFDKKITSETVDSIYQSLDIYHLMSLSGFLIGIILTFIKKILFYFNVSNHVYKYMSYGILLFLLYLQLGHFIILKILIFKMIKDINYQKEVGLNQLNIWHITFLIIFILKPYLIYSKGYLISFIIINIYTLININVNQYFFKRISIGLIISVLMLPFFKNMSFINILLTPIYLYLIGLGYFILSLCTLIMPFINEFFIEYIKFIESLLKYLNDINIIFHIPKIKSVYIFLWYIIIYLFLINKNIVKKLVYLIILLMIVFVPTLKYKFSNKLEVYFLNVGQGDASVVIYKDLVIVIDCFQYVEDFLKDKGIKKVDYLILTHSDIDHIKEANNLINHMEVGKIILSKYENYDIKHNHIYFPNPLDVIVHKDLKIVFLGPLKPYKTNNDQSLVIKLSIYNQSILFTGDIEKEAESDLVLNYGTILNSDILKVSHHGSKTSSTDIFIEYVKPKFAIFSYHINNKFDMPNNDVLSRIMTYTKDLYHTAIGGTTVCRIDISNIKCCYYYQ